MLALCCGTAKGQIGVPPSTDLYNRAHTYISTWLDTINTWYVWGKGLYILNYVTVSVPGMYQVDIDEEKNTYTSITEGIYITPWILQLPILSSFFYTDYCCVSCMMRQTRTTDGRSSTVQYHTQLAHKDEFWRGIIRCMEKNKKPSCDEIENVLKSNLHKHIYNLDNPIARVYIKYRVLILRGAIVNRTKSWWWKQEIILFFVCTIGPIYYQVCFPVIAGFYVTPRPSYQIDMYGYTALSRNIRTL